MLKVNVLYENSGDTIPHGASTLRLLLPLSHPKLTKSILLSSRTSYEGFDDDIIIVDRLWKPGIDIRDAEKLVEYAHKNKITLIYSIDDNLLDLKLIEPGNIYPSIQERNIIRYFIRESDGVIVSTYDLYERLRKLNERIVIIENTLDERLFDIRKRETLIDKNKNRDKLVIGYMGTPTHDGDFITILPAVKKILRKYEDSVKLEILGALSDKRLLKSLPNTMVVDTKGNVEYTKFMKWMNDNIFWDFAIAPLEKNDFTRCKSDIKFLDYSILGIPGIYTGHVPYNNTVIHGETGILVDNDTKSWIGAFEQLINNEDLRKMIGKNAKEYVFSSRILDICVHKWEEALFKIYNDKNRSAKFLQYNIDEITSSGERVTHIHPNDCYYAHLSIYHFALQFSKNGIVLDAGSGAGYGSAYIADHGASFVYGIEINAQSVKFSHHSFQRNNLLFQEMDLQKISGFPNHHFDFIFCSNVLEHIPDVQAFLREAWKLLKPEGVMLVAVPPITNDELRTADLENPYHLNIWTPHQWYNVLNRYFAEIQLYRHGFSKAGVALNFHNSPVQTIICEKDFIFEPVSFEQFVHSLTALFVVRRPRNENESMLNSPLMFVDNSFTRSTSLSEIRLKKN